MVLAVGGALGAGAFAVENAHQSWSALFLTDELGAGALVAASGPAVFAAVTALTRWTTSPLALRAPGHAAAGRRGPGRGRAARASP